MRTNKDRLFKDFSDENLLKHTEYVGFLPEELNKEWFRRYGMNLPYRLTFDNRILNCINKSIVNEQYCDKKIKEQADFLRGSGQEHLYW